MTHESSAGIPSMSGDPPPPWSMRTYVVAFLFRGAYQPADPAKAEEIQREHLAYVAQLFRDRKAIFVGPFLDETELRGMSLFDSDSIEEIRAICLADPAIRAGSLRAEVHPWYGAKGITFLPPEAPPTGEPIGDSGRTGHG